MSTLNVGTIKSAASNVPPVFKDSNGTSVGQLCRASIRLSQTGTQTINESFNVSSITDLGTGYTQINFTNAIRNEAGTATSYYAVSAAQDGSAVSTHHLLLFVAGSTSTALAMLFYNIDNSNVRADSSFCSVSIHA